MAIRLLQEVPHSELAGKFICTPTRQVNHAHGWPACIEQATRARLTFRRLPRGAWDESQKEWQVAVEPGPTGGLRLEDGTGLCAAASVRFVCDTAEEAITLYVASVHTQKLIESFRQENLKALDMVAQQGNLPRPGYLGGQQ